MGIITRGIPKEITIELARLNGSTIFIETGTYQGDTTRWASNHFESVHTIERAESLYNLYNEELSQIKGVIPYLGDSRDLLPDILHTTANQKSVFWLDGHWSGGETAGEDDECPLLDELTCLSNRSGDIVLIDDARLFLCAPPVPHNPTHWPTISEIVSVLSKSHTDPFVQIVDDVIFIIPKEDILKDCLVAYAQKRASFFWAEYLKHQ
jgi:hypothetical protein